MARLLGSIGHQRLISYVRSSAELGPVTSLTMG